MTMLRTLQVLALAATLLVGAVWGQGQPAPAAAARERILGTAQRKGEPESVVAPILARLDRLASQGLPTDRFASIMVEGLSKGASPQALVSNPRTRRAIWVWIAAWRTTGSREGMASSVARSTTSASAAAG